MYLRCNYHFFVAVLSMHPEQVSDAKKSCCAKLHRPSLCLVRSREVTVGGGVVCSLHCNRGAMEMLLILYVKVTSAPNRFCSWAKQPTRLRSEAKPTRVKSNSSTTIATRPTSVIIRVHVFHFFSLLDGAPFLPSSVLQRFHPPTTTTSMMVPLKDENHSVTSTTTSNLSALTKRFATGMATIIPSCHRVGLLFHYYVSSIMQRSPFRFSESKLISSPDPPNEIMHWMTLMMGLV